MGACSTAPSARYSQLTVRQYDLLILTYAYAFWQQPSQPLAVRRKVVVAAKADDLRLATRREGVIWVNVHVLDRTLGGVELLGASLVEGVPVGRDLVVVFLLELGADVATVMVRRARRAVRGACTACTCSARACSARACTARAC